MKKVLAILLGMAALAWPRAVADSTNPPDWVFPGSILIWDAPTDPARTGWNVVLTLPNVFDLPASDAARTNGPAILNWAVVTDAGTNRFPASELFKGIPLRTNFVAWVSARNADGNYSDWASLGLFSGYTPKNLRLK